MDRLSRQKEIKQMRNSVKMAESLTNICNIVEHYTNKSISSTYKLLISMVYFIQLEIILNI